MVIDPGAKETATIVVIDNVAVIISEFNTNHASFPFARLAPPVTR